MQPPPNDHAPELRASEFAQVKRLMHGRFGIELRPGKEHLVRARLAKILRQEQFASFGEYFNHVAADKTGEALINLANALTTNHTSFFREPAHFDFLKQWLASQRQAPGPIQIWSAACATGEEPYSIACTALDEWEPEAARAKIRILASDVSTRALQTGAAGIYAEARFDSQPMDWKRRHLLRGSGRWAGCYQFKPHVRHMIEFKRINLMEPLAALDRFSIIFCRNVLIYFDTRTQELVINRLAERLEPQGYLFVGHAEGLFAHKHPLHHVCPAVYQKGSEPRRSHS